MTEDNKLLVDAPLIADPDAEEELGPSDAKAIADEDLQGSRLLLALKSVQSIDIDGEPGGLVELSCTFQPNYGTRFSWARLILRLTSPENATFIDIAPKEIKDSHPVKISVGNKGMLGLKYAPAEAGIEQSQNAEFEVYQCTVQGSGVTTAKARWDFRESDHRQNGLGTSQVLAFTLPVTGKVSGLVLVSARLAKQGVGGAVASIKDMILGPGQTDYGFTFEIPAQ